LLLLPNRAPLRGHIRLHSGVGGGVRSVIAPAVDARFPFLPGIMPGVV
jgi:hypothetical protein